MSPLFVKALKNGFDMSNEDAVALAHTVQKVFKRSKEVEDMSLHKDIRSIFYELHQKNLLCLRREEVKEKGKSIRKYYWSFNDDGIRVEADRRPTVESPYEIYKKIPENAWLLHSCNT
jgi:hemerythrin-like domain-containing protein